MLKIADLLAVFQIGGIKSEGGSQIIASKRRLLKFLYIHMIVHDGHGRIGCTTGGVEILICFSRRRPDNLVRRVRHYKGAVRSHKVRTRPSGIEVFPFDRQFFDRGAVSVKRMVFDIEVGDRPGIICRQILLKIIGEALSERLVIAGTPVQGRVRILVDDAEDPLVRVKYRAHASGIHFVIRTSEPAGYQRFSVFDHPVDRKGMRVGAVVHLRIQVFIIG